MNDIAQKKDFLSKVEKLRDLVKRKNAKGLIITTTVNFAWLTGGRSFVSIADDNSTGKILITLDKLYLIASSNEVPRLIDEELSELPLEVMQYHWYELFSEELLLKNSINLPIIYDRDVEDEVAILRSTLSELELRRIKKLGKISAKIVEKMCRKVQIGMKENEIAGELAREFWSVGIEPLVMNIAADDRSLKYRHPIPTCNELKEHLAMSLCVRKWGLNVTLTRIVHFGSLSDEWKRKHNAAIQIEAYAQYRSKPGVKVKEIFDNMKELYTELNFENEWKKHPIGGLIGFKPREFDVNNSSEQVLEKNQSFCWNPTIEGTKSEDTIIITSDGFEIITETGEFPYILVEIENEIIKKPDILVREK